MIFNTTLHYAKVTVTNVREFNLTHTKIVITSKSTKNILKWCNNYIHGFAHLPARQFSSRTGLEKSTIVDNKQFKINYCFQCKISQISVVELLF
ncbi:hypothetical protein CANARDRAFT_71575 [[Candida] arabinofermentans NRRL YB-2248]|uniref:Uncharacterized protein n=1 Tax=[Candida] arabinofermentans NRRL YB-2248 TaxID=983967 RepID=A0A1E4SWF6_9ASCO|nr:hypothetical protein CANARDRAFT_71575 [[Candida] arabinofermentans NRRL YB-2248]